MRMVRISGKGYVYHIVTKCNNFDYRFNDPEDFQRFLHRLKLAKVKHKVKLYAYCIMNNHVHLLVHTPEEDNISKFMEYLNGNSAKDYNRAHGRRGHFWNDRFHSTVIESGRQFFNTMFYIEFNMVKARGVKRPEDWKWSSFNAHAYGVHDPVIDLPKRYLNLGETPEERQKLYREMAKGYMKEKGLVYEPVLTDGRVIGSEEFVQSVVDEVSKRKPKLKGKIHQYAPGNFCLNRRFKMKLEAKEACK